MVHDLDCDYEFPFSREDFDKNVNKKKIFSDVFCYESKLIYLV